MAAKVAWPPTELWEACYHTSTEHVQRLLESGADPDAPDGLGFTAMQG